MDTTIDLDSYRGWSNWQIDKYDFNPLAIKGANISDVEFVSMKGNEDLVGLANTPHLIVQYISRNPDENRTLKKALACNGMLCILKTYA